MTRCSVTYVTPPFLKKLSPSASLNLVECGRSKGPFETSPTGFHQRLGWCTFDSPHKVKVTFSISMPNELVWTFPARSQCSLLPWLLHLYHRLPYNQTLKQMLTFFGSVGLPLFLLCLLHIEQDVFMDACNPSSVRTVIS